MNVHPAADLFPLLVGDELKDLADDIAANGLHEPVWLYDDPDRGTVLLDGRNRVNACEMVGVEVVTRVYAGADPIGFVVSENIKRRHLTAWQRDSLTLSVAEMLADKSALVHLKSTPKRGRPSTGDTMDAAAKATGGDRRGAFRVQRVRETAPDLAAKADAGEMSAVRAERIIRDRESEARKVEEARRAAALAPVPVTVDIRHGDFREELSDLTNIDAIITDPPYPAEFLPLLGDLAAWADKVLAPEGVLAVLMGQTHLPEVYRLLGGYRIYRWTACYLTPGAGYASHARRVQSNWKPLLIYGGGSRFADVFTSEGRDADAKSNHKWGQDYSAFHTIIERLTVAGQTVVDPFMGSGTTLLAANALGRNAIGCDVDTESVATARRRLV